MLSCHLPLDHTLHFFTLHTHNPTQFLHNTTTPPFYLLNTLHIHPFIPKIQHPHLPTHVAQFWPTLYIHIHLHIIAFTFTYTLTSYPLILTHSPHIHTYTPQVEPLTIHTHSSPYHHFTHTLCTYTYTHTPLHFFCTSLHYTYILTQSMHSTLHCTLGLIHTISHNINTSKPNPIYIYTHTTSPYLLKGKALFLHHTYA